MSIKKNRDVKNYNVIVVGGGASGMIAAAIAAKSGQRVLLVEKNSTLGKKLSITGGGRCNITNAEENTRTLLSNYGDSSKQLFSAFSRFGMQDSLDFFDSIGIKTKIEARKRAFPISESAQEVVDALQNQLSKHNVTVMIRTVVDRIESSKGKITGVVAGGAEYTADKYILATGGTSRPETGSTGDGFNWLSKLGHTVNEPTPNITPLSVKEKWVKDVSGTTLQNADIIFYSEGTRAFKAHGDILFTHFGISGPTILNNAYKVAELLEQGNVIATIDCYPRKNHKELDQQLLIALQENPTKMLKNTLRFIAPAGFSKLFDALLSKDFNTEVSNSELSKESRAKIIKLLKELSISIEGLMGFDKAVVADGGVDLKEIDTRNMQSKIIKNLYVTGDLLDINRPSGGYSLQLCWTTGYLAGIS